MKVLTLLMVLGVPVAPGGLVQTRNPGGSARLVEVRAEPHVPNFGEAFDLHVILRMRRGVIAFLPDTLEPTYSVESVGPGVWSEEPAPGDSVGIRATYPVIGLREGRAELPSIEVWTRPAVAGERRDRVIRRRSEARNDRGESFERRTMRLGVVEVGQVPAMADSAADLVPRPPADVLGSGWSTWLVLAVGVASVAGLLGVWMIARRWRAAILTRRMRGRSPREETLRELERIRAFGWHRNGRMDDFYGSSTGALRRFAASIDPAWGAALTSTELIARLAGRWGQGGVDSLAAAVAAAEQVKFGTLQRNTEAAEGDWETIVTWVRGAPEG
ncbi:MAG: hypothetical protein EXR93_07350 [Gemmatimonadetes bacterium]|nr:hypothetical protein [Gemmatimonadota bacterium]